MELSEINGNSTRHNDSSNNHKAKSVQFGPDQPHNQPHQQRQSMDQRRLSVEQAIEQHEMEEQSEQSILSLRWLAEATGKAFQSGHNESLYEYLVARANYYFLSSIPVEVSVYYVYYVFRLCCMHAHLDIVACGCHYSFILLWIFPTFSAGTPIPTKAPEIRIWRPIHGRNYHHLCIFRSYRCVSL
jgi:hypothetical protein